jgi:hypothetical protein
MTAIEEAQQYKREIEQRLADEFKEFTERTGLKVSGVTVLAIETTMLEDPFPKFGSYQVKVEVVI